MAVEGVDKEALSSICVNLCKGACCDPWWGIVEYAVTKHNGLSGLKEFKGELSDGIRKRAERIKSQYVTGENPPRHLFKDPQRCNVTVESIRINGSTLLINLRAMFAFRCVFLSPEKTCLIHPAIINTDIRPARCSFLGSGGARPGTEGYCRIIDAAVKSSGGEREIIKAAELERKTSETYYGGGFSTIEEASDRIIGEIQRYCSENAPYLTQTAMVAKAPGRNAPCFCGSGIKYKRCHGRQ